MRYVSESYVTFLLFTGKQTIVSTCLPTIIQDLDGSQSEYTWIGVAYLLTQTACQPLYGRISDLTGRKVGRRQFDLSIWKLILLSLYFSQVSLYLPSAPYCVVLLECVILLRSRSSGCNTFPGLEMANRRTCALRRRWRGNSKLRLGYYFGARGSPQ